MVQFDSCAPIRDAAYVVTREELEALLKEGIPFATAVAGLELLVEMRANWVERHPLAAGVTKSRIYSRAQADFLASRRDLPSPRVIPMQARYGAIRECLASRYSHEFPWALSPLP